VTLGDGNADIAHSKGLTPTMSEVETTGDGYENTIRAYTSDTAGMGSMFAPAINDVDEKYLTPGVIDTFEMDESALREFFSFADMPVLHNGEFCWSSEF